MSAVSADEREDSSSLLAGREAIVGIDSVFTVGSELKAKLRSELLLSEELRVERRAGDSAWKTLEASLEAREVRMMGEVQRQVEKGESFTCGVRIERDGANSGSPASAMTPALRLSDFQLSAEGKHSFSPPFRPPHST